MEEETTTQESTNQSSPLVMVAILIVIAVIAGVMVMMQNNKAKTEASMQKEMVVTKVVSPTEAVKTASDSSQSDSSVQIVDIEAGSYYYKPATMTLKKGDKVKVVLHAVSMVHNFNIDELNVHMPMVKNGETGTVEFTADKAGTFQYYCSVGQHRKLGQVGTLTVE